MDKKLVAITGASSGFGKEMAVEFSNAGYPLLLMARRIDKLQELNLPNTICAQVDVTNPESIAIAVKQAEIQYGKIDLLVNNAGLMQLGSVETQDAKEWQDMLNTNVMGVLNCMKAVIPQMKEREGGTIINIASIAGIQPFDNHAAYCASKYGVVGLTRTTRGELSKFNVRVMMINPGAVDTELLGHTTNKEIIGGYLQWKDDVGAVNIMANDVAVTTKFAYEMPQHVTLREIVITDTRQDA